MKKIVSIILAALMLCALCAPAFAEDEPTVIEPSGGVINIFTAGNYIIKGDYSLNDICVGTPSMTDVTLTFPKGVTVTATNDFKNFGTINVCGTLIISDSADFKTNFGTINIMSCCGKLEGTVINNYGGTVNTYNEHSFENGKCTYCGTYECMVTAKHNWVNGVCSVCNTPCEHKWDANTGKCTVCELVCTHGGDKCDICGKELVNLNTGSSISDGNVLIVIAIAAAVIFGFSGYFLGKKKRVA